MTQTTRPSAPSLELAGRAHNSLRLRWSGRSHLSYALEMRGPGDDRYVRAYVCVCVCVRERERERVREISPEQRKYNDLCDISITKGSLFLSLSLFFRFFSLLLLAVVCSGS